ncbi:hypothetical protein ScPMuIL_007337, partial [Solemya velum]
MLFKLLCTTRCQRLYWLAEGPSLYTRTLGKENSHYISERVVHETLKTVIVDESTDIAVHPLHLLLKPSSSLLGTLQCAGLGCFLVQIIIIIYHPM